MGVNFDAREPARVVSCKRPSSPLRMTLRARACPAAGTSDSLIRCTLDVGVFLRCAGDQYGPYIVRWFVVSWFFLSGFLDSRNYST